MENNPGLTEINEKLNKSYIYYEPTREDYAISKKELELLENTGSPIWKDVFLTTIGLSIPSLINGMIGLDQYSSKTTFPIYTFISLLVGCVTFVLAIISMIIWLNTKSTFKRQIEEIRNKPKFIMPKGETTNKTTEKPTRRIIYASSPDADKKT
jgi:putative Mn2+ efflux pump MntP